MGCVIKLSEKFSGLSSIWLEWSEDAARLYGQVAVDRSNSILCPFSNYSRCTCPYFSI